MVSGSHFVSKEIDLAASVTEDDSLSDVKSLVEIAKGVEFPLLTVHGNVELLDTLKGKLITLHENTDGVVHETLGDLEGLRGHGGREQTNLRGYNQQQREKINNNNNKNRYSIDHEQ